MINEIVSHSLAVRKTQPNDRVANRWIDWLDLAAATTESVDERESFRREANNWISYYLKVIAVR